MPRRNTGGRSGVGITNPTFLQSEIMAAAVVESTAPL